jgi:hypothetical protein
MLANIRQLLQGALRVIVLTGIGAAVACVVNLNVGARQAPARDNVQSDDVSVASTVDRTHKGNRLPSLSPAAERKALPGCERPFSPLAKGSPSIFNGRCVT